MIGGVYLNNIEELFFLGNMRSCYEMAKSLKEENNQYLAIFIKHGFDELPTIPKTKEEQSFETPDEHYKEEQQLLYIRSIKEETLFKEEIKKLEHLARTGTDSEKAHSFFTQGYLFLYAHHYEESLHCFRQAVKMMPSNAIYAGICGQTIFRLNISPLEALAYLEHALQLQPTNARWYWNKALVLMQLYKDLQEEAFLNNAIYELQQAIHYCRDDQSSLHAALQSTEQEIGQLIACGQ